MGKDAVMGDVPDIYMNFASVEAAANAADSSLLSEGEELTNLSLPMRIAWEIHYVELFAPVTLGSLVTDVAEIVLSTRTHPGVGTAVNGWSQSDYGCIQKWEHNTIGALHPERIVRYLPPILFAARRLYLTIRSIAGDVAAFRGNQIGVRVGYTATKLTAQKYMEVLQTWDRTL